MEANEIVKAIGLGTYDESLDAFDEIIRWRRNVLGALVGMQLKPGDRVRFVSTINPKYLAGVEATIRGKRTKKFTVDLDHPTGRFFRGIIVSPTLIEKVD